MKNIFLSCGIVLGTFAILLALVSSRYFWSLPFVPASVQNSLAINASIFPAGADSRALFLAVNPGFRAKFGDKEMAESAFLRFEVLGEAEASAGTGVNPSAFVDLSEVYQSFQEYQPGFTYQLFSTGVDQSQVFEQGLVENELAWDFFLEGSETELVASEEPELAVVLSERDQVKTETVVKREDGYDWVENLEVGVDTDLTYKIEPGRGLTNQIIIGDRADFDTACLQLLSLGIPSSECDLPNNRFSFLIQVDPGMELEHSPLSIDGGRAGSYYLRSGDEVLARLANPSLRDAGGAESESVSLEVTSASVGGEEAEGYYIATIVADLDWLLESERTFPVTIESGFYLDNLEFFAGESWE